MTTTEKIIRARFLWAIDLAAKHHQALAFRAWAGFETIVYPDGETVPSLEAVLLGVVKKTK